MFILQRIKANETNAVFWIMKNPTDTDEDLILNPGLFFIYKEVYKKNIMS